MKEQNTTIAAIATPPGEGGVAMIRISGKEAREIASSCFSHDVLTQESHTLKFGTILDEHKNPIDEVLLAVMQAPRSFTGEDVVEIYCHGGSFVSQKILKRILSCGAKAAGPGEFSLRAYLNGKIDLAKAEAIASLIHAKNDLALSAEESQLRGALSLKITKFQESLTEVAAIIEAWVDYPEEGLEFASKEEILQKLQFIALELTNLKATFRDGRILSHGIDLCILGAPNVGKSSLMNALIGYDRAIVTDIAGTTRDVLEEKIQFGSLHFNLIDTAGIRPFTSDIIEKEGMRRSLEKAEKADILLLVLDSSRPLLEEEKELQKSLPEEKTLVVYNKIDLGAPYTGKGICISAEKGLGLDHLKKAIEEHIFEKGPPSKEAIILTKERHYKAVEEALSALKLVIEGLEGDLSAEFISFDLRQALKHLSSIMGINVTEEILNEIFSKFCVGK